MSKIDTFIVNSTPLQESLLAKMPRKSPGPRYRHVRFFRIAIGDAFFSGNSIRTKRGHFSASTSAGKLVRVMPWEKVRSCRQIISAATANATTAIWKKAFPPNMGQTIHRIGCQGDSDAHDALIMATHAAQLTGAYNAKPFTIVDTGGDRTPESIGGTEKTPSA